ncbi:MAG: MerR family transcriptional regulator [Anaerolineae bacterium]|nr:MerR family transcriptional regulator [Anaerolineae bacterium]
MLTIGELARQAGLRPSALRYYEAEGLIVPTGRTEAGYRLYDPSAAATLRLIQRAQGLGFSLAEIRTLLSAWRDGDLDNAETLATAEGRYLALERQITELRVQQHELEMFLLDLRGGAPDAAQTAFGLLVDRICANPAAELPSRAVLDRLVAADGCLLTSPAAREPLARLRGRHIHVWREEDAYHILFVGHDPAAAAALAEIVRLESGCRAHPDLRLELLDNDEGHLLIVHGDSAFILARLFLALENETP